MVWSRRLTGTPLLRISAEVAVRSRVPETRPASAMTSRLVMGDLLACMVREVNAVNRILLDRRQIGFGEGSSGGVFGADTEWSAIEGFEGPGDVEGGVVPEDGSFSGWVVGVGGFVEDFGGVGEDEEAVGEAFGDPEELQVVARGLSFQVKAGPPSEVRRVAAEVDGDIPDMTREHTDEFALRPGELVVQAAKDAFDGEGLVVLNESGGKTGRGKGGLVEYLCEPAATISEALGLNEFDVFERRVQNLHCTSLAS